MHSSSTRTYGLHQEQPRGGQALEVALSAMRGALTLYLLLTRVLLQVGGPWRWHRSTQRSTV